jgi:hypothetical protein
MNKILTTKLMDILLGISACLLIIGALFKIQHYPYGDLILTVGFLTNIAFSGIEIQRLRQIIKENNYKE